MQVLHVVSARSVKLCCFWCCKLCCLAVKTSPPGCDQRQRRSLGVSRSLLPGSNTRLLQRQCAMTFVALVEVSGWSGECVGAGAWQLKGGNSVQDLKNLGRADLVCVKGCQGVIRSGRSVILAAVPV